MCSPDNWCLVLEMAIVRTECALVKRISEHRIAQLLVPELLAIFAPTTATVTRMASAFAMEITPEDFVVTVWPEISVKTAPTCVQMEMDAQVMAIVLALEMEIAFVIAITREVIAVSHKKIGHEKIFFFEKTVIH